jgi:histone-lysine N-methyltransferase SETD1
MTRSQSAGFAQFFPAASQAAVDRATERRKAKAKAYDSTASPIPTIVGAGDASHAQSPSADGLRPPVDENASPYGDVLPTTQGSASSHASTGSSVFSATAPPLGHTSNGTSHPPGTNFTPLTTLDSPSHLSHHAQQKSNNMLAASSPDHPESVGSAPLLNGSLATSNADTARIQARDPGPSRKGIKCTYDPILDRSLTKDRKNAKPIFQEFGRVRFEHYTISLLKGGRHRMSETRLIS